MRKIVEDLFVFFVILYKTNIVRTMRVKIRRQIFTKRWFFLSGDSVKSQPLDLIFSNIFFFVSLYCCVPVSFWLNIYIFAYDYLASVQSSRNAGKVRTRMYNETASQNSHSNVYVCDIFFVYLFVYYTRNDFEPLNSEEISSHNYLAIDLSDSFFFVFFLFIVTRLYLLCSMFRGIIPLLLQWKNAVVQILISPLDFFIV